MVCMYVRTTYGTLADTKIHLKAMLLLESWH